MRRDHRPATRFRLEEHVHEVRVWDTEQRIHTLGLEQVENALVNGHTHSYNSFPSPAVPISASTSAVWAPSSGAGPATRPGVRENQVGTPGKRTGPCGVSSVWNMPTALRCGSSKSAPGVFSGAAGISSSRNSTSHSWVERCFIVSATSP